MNRFLCDFVFLHVQFTFLQISFLMVVDAVAGKCSPLLHSRIPKEIMQILGLIDVKYNSWD